VQIAPSLNGPPNFPGEQGDYSPPVEVTQQSCNNDADPCANWCARLVRLFLQSSIMSGPSIIDAAAFQKEAKGKIARCVLPGDDFARH